MHGAIVFTAILMSGGDRSAFCLNKTIDNFVPTSNKFRECTQSLKISTVYLSFL